LLSQYGAAALLNFSFINKGNSVELSFKFQISYRKFT